MILKWMTPQTCMINITFKNVGQGDSIVIEWKHNSKNKVGIIDCNLFDKKNPTLEHIISAGYSSIEFIILSHPHYDHFSGIRELLEYCEENIIVIKKFLHTSQQVPDYLRVATKSVISSNELVLLFSKINDLRKKQVIEFVTYISDEVKGINLNERVKLEFLAPSSVEYERFLSKTPLFDEEGPHNNAQANWLSTIVKIYTSDWYILLTSDSTLETLKRVGIQKKEEFLSNLKLGQSPHHGAKSNHYDAFWKTKNHEPNTPIVFSVGPNFYKHPSEKALNFFSQTKNKFKIFSTNQVGSLSMYNSSLQSSTISSYLDLAGSQQVISPMPSSQYQGEQSFSF